MHKKYIDSKEVQATLEREIYWINTKMKEAQHAREDDLKEGKESGLKKGKTIGIADTLINLLKNRINLTEQMINVLNNTSIEKTTTNN